ncbi:MAG: hypothetical protein JWQ29_1538 [Phenylobacterium sp.]|nr:hypothetical protein [Phenylobacterium sp.]
MAFSFKRAVVASAIGLALLGAGQAGAAIYDIDATDEVGTAITLGVGAYRVEFIGIADGGAYDSAFVDCTGAACSTGWSNRFSVRDSDFADAFLPGGSSTVDVFSVGLSNSFASAAASLAAYKAGPIDHYGVDIDSGVVGAPYLVETFASSPFTVHFSNSDTFHLVVTDYGSRAGNQGGVSLRITAVPEPASWALMIGGFGLTGAGLRRRQRGGLAA